MGISQEGRNPQEVGVAGSWWWHPGSGRTWNGGLWDVLELLYIPATEFGPEGLISPTEVLGFPICIKYREQNS